MLLVVPFHAAHSPIEQVNAYTSESEDIESSKTHLRHLHTKDWLAVVG